MSVTQADDVTWLNSVVGQHLDYDHQYGQQCVDFFNFNYKFCTGRDPYADGLHSPAVSGAKDLWTVRVGGFTYIPDSSTLTPQSGDIAIYGTAWGAGDGHVEVVVSSDDTGCTFVGENEHGDTTQGVVRVTRTWAQMRGLLGVMRPDWLASIPPFTISVTSFSGQYTVNPGMNKWNLDLATFDAIDNNPVTYSPPNPIAFTAQLTRSDIPQYTYYLEDANVHQGYNSLDVTAYIPAAPVVAAPYVPPAAPTVYKATQKYTLKKTMMYFSSASDAMATQNAKGTIAEGTYLVFSTSGVAYNLTTNNMQNQNKWINTQDNVIDNTVVVPTSTAPITETVLKPSQVQIGGDSDTKWKGSFVAFYADYRAVRYKTTKRLFILEYSGKRGGVELAAGSIVNSFGTFEKNGVEFYRILANNDTHYDWYYGISQLDDSGQANLLKQEERLTDYLRYIGSDIKDVFDIFFRKRK